MEYDPAPVGKKVEAAGVHRLRPDHSRVHGFAAEPVMRKISVELRAPKRSVPLKPLAKKENLER